MTEASASTQDVATGRGSIDDVPELPEGVTDVFSSRYVTARDVRLHVVIGGSGPALLVLGGWPQTWYAWRHVMVELAQTHTVVVVEPRGVGLSDKPAQGYDSGTHANDMVTVMAALGFDQFDMIGYDIGMWTAFAMAVDHPGHIQRLVVAEAIIPGVAPSPPLLADRKSSDTLWHFGFNRAYEVNELLVRGREDIYFGYQFATKAGHPEALEKHAVDHYIEMYSDPEALRASFDNYRAIDQIIEQNTERRTSRITIPVLGVGGDLGLADNVAEQIALVADDVTTAVIAGSGHYPAEEAPQEFLDAVKGFLTT